MPCASISSHFDASKDADLKTNKRITHINDYNIPAAAVKLTMKQLSIIGPGRHAGQDREITLGKHVATSVINHSNCGCCHVVYILLIERMNIHSTPYRTKIAATNVPYILQVVRTESSREVVLCNFFHIYNEMRLVAIT